ncbi:hypothetical protein BN2475_470079 [Paraburkholderia ribeironis]|uniref:Uncharacterized protein n=1 Tax=Paraburkholderia ribeironis TaxID=1247936 RepID=A0A1N7SA86_9BURK|nr:hypothetical protein BN2475_470079 [Paraburkholderia ribeironis]
MGDAAKEVPLGAHVRSITQRAQFEPPQVAH